MGLEDKDLLIDVQVGSKQEVTNVFIANKVVVVKKEKPKDLLALREKNDGKQSVMTGGAEQSKFEIGKVGDVMDKIARGNVTTKQLTQDSCGNKMDKARLKYGAPEKGK